MRGLISRLRHDVDGVSAMEFALILPLLVMFSAGTIEYSRLILATQKLQSGAFTLADLTARYDDDDMNAERLADIFLAIGQVVQPFDFAADGRAILTSIGADEDDDPFVQDQCVGSAELDATSEIGELGEAATLPDDHRRRGVLPIRAAVRHRPRAEDDPARRLLQAAPRRSHDVGLSGRGLIPHGHVNDLIPTILLSIRNPYAFHTLSRRRKSP
jgi:hypothetical protein